MSVVAQKKELKILHSALCMGAFLMLVAMTWLVGLPSNASLYAVNSELLLGLFAASGALIVAPSLFNSRTKNINSLDNSSDVMEELRAAYILKWALIEGPLLINVVLFFFAENVFHLLIAIILLCFLLLNAPKIDRWKI